MQVWRAPILAVVVLVSCLIGLLLGAILVSSRLHQWLKVRAPPSMPAHRAWLQPHAHAHMLACEPGPLATDRVLAVFG